MIAWRIQAHPGIPDGPSVVPGRSCRCWQRSWLTRLVLVPVILLFVAAPAYPQPVEHDQHRGAPHSGHVHDGPMQIWEGSPEGTAYSESNHHLTGSLIVLIGVSEMHAAIGIAVFPWMRFLLPIALSSAGLFLLGWSDHDSWPIGSQTVTDTFFSGDWETIQHKWFGIVSLVIGGLEGLRRLSYLRHPAWRIPLPTFAILGGLSLLLHSHGVHPSAHKIAVHHAIMAVTAVTAGTSKLVSWWRSPSLSRRSPWELAWATLILVIGVQLLFYSE